MSFKKMSGAVVCFFVLSYNTIGCGFPEEGLESADQMLVPSWLQHIPKQWDCQQTIQHRFSGKERGHLYSFSGTAGVRYTFSFQTTASSWQGVGISIYDAGSTQRVGFKNNPWGNKVALSYKAQKTGKLLVGVYGLVGYLKGNYTLASRCEEPTPQGTFCGGIAAIRCPQGYDCVLDGNYPDAGGQCKKSPAGQFCGGFGVIPCPSGYQCILDGDFEDAGGKCQKK